MKIFYILYVLEEYRKNSAGCGAYEIVNITPYNNFMFKEHAAAVSVARRRVDEMNQGVQPGRRFSFTIESVNLI